MKNAFLYVAICFFLSACAQVKQQAFSLGEKEIEELRELAKIKPASDFEVSITDFGAVGDGKTSATKAFQQAVNFVYSKGGGIVRIPEGTFLLTKTQGGRQLLIPKPGVSIIGKGDKSVLKVADNTIRFLVYYSVSQNPDMGISNAVFKDFTIDCNGENNLPDGKNRNMNRCIGSRFGENILIDNVTVLNNPGRQCFQFGNNEMPFTVTNLAIQNCNFFNVGRNVDGNTTQNDHSAVYAQAQNCLIRNNDFRNPDFEMDATAIEAHLTHGLLEGNYVQNFATGCNIVSAVTDTKRLLVRNNNFDGIERGLLFYCYEGYEMDRVEVVSNKFIQISSTNGIIDLSSNVERTIGSLRITDNLIKNTDEPGKRTPPGIKLGSIDSVSISGNKFVGTAGNAIRIGKIKNDVLNAVIEGNQFLDCVKTSDPNYKQVISIKSTKTANSILIRANKFINSNPKKRVQPIEGSMKVKKLSVDDNNFEGYSQRKEGKWLKKAKNKSE